MTQSTPTIGANQSGLTYRQQDNDGKKALLNHHKGSSAPSYAEAGIIWLDDSATPWKMKIYDGADWITLGDVHATNNTFTPYVGTAAPRILNDAADTGSANAYAIAPSPAISAYATGQVAILRPTNANTGASTININSLGTKNIKLLDGSNPSSGMIKTTGAHVLVYDGTNFILTNPALGSGAYLTAGTSANNLVQLDGSAKLPAIDGSQLTNLPNASAYVLLDTKTASNSASLNFTTGISTAYSRFIFVFEEITFTLAADTRMRISQDGGSTWKNANSSYRWTTRQAGIDTATPTQTLVGSSTAATRAYIQLVSTGGSTLDCGIVELIQSTSNAYKRFFHRIYSQGGEEWSGFSLYYADTNAINGIQFYPSSGNFNTGKIYMYGIKNT